MKSVKMNDDLFQRAERLAVERGLSVDDLVSDLVAKATVRATDPGRPRPTARALKWARWRARPRVA